MSLGAWRLTPTLRDYIFVVYTVSQKTRTLDFCQQLCQQLTDFQNSFTDRLISNFAIKSLFNILQHFKTRALGYAFKSGDWQI